MSGLPGMCVALRDAGDIKEIERLNAQVVMLRKSNVMFISTLQFYARSEHFTRHQDVWDSVSGEPENFLEDENNTATVEDGSFAKAALVAVPDDWIAAHDVKIRQLDRDRANTAEHALK